MKHADFQSVRGPMRFNNANFPIENMYRLKVVHESSSRISRTATTSTAR